jgi:hypothetical protein
MKRIKVALLSILLIGSIGCITTGSKDKAMIKTVADVLVVKEEISQEDRDIIVNIIEAYEE